VIELTSLDIAKLAPRLYFYRATVTRVIDGDTVEVEIDQGLKTKRVEETIRLNRVNSPETNRKKSRPAGLRAKAFTERELSGKVVYLQTFKASKKKRKEKKGKFGRYVVEIWLPNGRNFNDLLVSAGHAAYAKY